MTTEGFKSHSAAETALNPPGIMLLDALLMSLPEGTVTGESYRCYKSTVHVYLDNRDLYYMQDRAHFANIVYSFLSKTSL